MGLYIILMGVQGAGKGEQAKFIQRQYGNIPHVSTGDLFRAMRTRSDALAQRVQQIMAEGRLVDDETTSAVLKDRLEQADAAAGAILDGYPRNESQAAWLESYLAQRGEKLTAVILLELDLYKAFKRAFGRVSAKSGKTYNVYYNGADLDWRFEDHPEGAYPPRLVATDRHTGESLVRRADDASAHAILKRIDTYVDTTTPLIQYFQRQNLLHCIDADQSIDAVGANIRHAIDAARSG